MQFSNAGPCSLGRVRSIERQECSDALYFVIYQNKAMGKSVLQIDSLQFLKARGVVVRRDRPPCPRVLVKGQRKCVRCCSEVERGRGSNRVVHSSKLPITASPTPVPRESEPIR